MNVGDINTHFESFDNYIKDYILFYEGGKIKQINGYGLDLEGELRLAISSKFAISVGVGYMSGKSESDFQTVGNFGFGDVWITWTPTLYEFAIESKVQAIPVTLRISYTFPLSNKINFFLTGGLGCYFSKAHIFKYIQRTPLTGIWPDIDSIWNECDVKGNSIGFQGGIGFEYNVVKPIALVLEVQGRQARIRELKGKITYDELEEDEGILFIGERDMTDEGFGEFYPDLIISPTRPTGTEFRNIKKAVSDFSGISVRAGIRIKLF